MSLRPKRLPWILAPLVLPMFSGGLACGGASPEPAAPKSAETKSTASTTPPDVSAVPAPKTLLLFGRVAKPGDLLQIASGWSGLPLPPDVVSEIVADAPIAKATDLTQPIDLAVASDARGRSAVPGLALSVAMRPLEEARPILEKSFTLKATSGGVYRLEGKIPAGATDDDEGDDARKCALYPAFGSPLRLVCATSSQTLETLGPYLARSTPRAKYASDVHVEVTLEPVRPMLTQGRTLLPNLLGPVLGLRREQSPAAFELGGAVIGDLVDFGVDLDKLDIDAKIADPGADATLTASFKSTESLIARVALSHPERADAPPAAFWRMPASSDSAFFHRGIDEKDIAHARDTVLESISRQLAAEGVAEADKTAIKNVVSHLTSLAAAPAAWAKGLDFEAEQKAVQTAKANSDPKLKADLRRAVGEQLAGWSLVSIEEPIAKVSGVVKELSTVLARPAIAKGLKAAGQGAPAPTLKATASARAAALPKGTMHFELTVVRTETSDMLSGAVVGTSKDDVPGKKAPARAAAPKLAKPVKLHVFLVPEGTRTLVGFGIDEALAVKTLGGVVASEASPPGSTSPSASLQQRQDLAELKRAKLSAGGFFDLRAVFGGSPVGYVSERESSSPDRDPFRALLTTPAKGAAPIPFTLLAQPAKDASAGTFVATAKVSKAAVQDIVAAVVRPRQ